MIIKSGKLSSGHGTRKVQFSFQSQRKAIPKSVDLYTVRGSTLTETAHPGQAPQ